MNQKQPVCYQCGKRLDHTGKYEDLPPFEVTEWDADGSGKPLVAWCSRECLAESLPNLRSK